LTLSPSREISRTAVNQLALPYCMESREALVIWATGTISFRLNICVNAEKNLVLWYLAILLWKHIHYLKSTEALVIWSFGTLVPFYFN
jgi:hypothetical protein